MGTAAARSRTVEGQNGGVPHYSSVSPALVGRAAQVDALSRSIRAVHDGGDARLVLVSGPAGMGKSRLVAEAHRLAGELGMPRLEGQCAPDAGLPYIALVSALRRRTRSMQPDELGALFTGPASLAAALLPEVAELTGLIQHGRAPEDLFAATWHVLARLARVDPPTGGLLVLEDLHWADPGTLSFLSYLARESAGLPLAVVGTYRSDEMHRRHPLAELVAELTRERRFDAVSVAPLAPAEVGAMLSGLFDGTEVSEEFASAVADRTEGNPFFVEELMKVLVERGDLYRLGSDWERRELDEIEMPQSVRETLLARARTMPDELVRVLQLAAMAGTQVDQDVVQLAADVTPGIVEDAIRAGLALQILVERRDGTGASYAFRHALSREAFAEELVGPDRRRAHRDIGRALERVHAGHVDPVAAVIADHLAAAHEGDAVEYKLRAARYATAMVSVDEADQLYDQALRLMPPDDPRRLPVTLEAVGTSNARMSPMKVAFAEDARRMAHSLGDELAEASALIAIAAYRWLEGRGRDGIARTREALDLVRGRDDSMEAFVVARLSRIRALADDLEPDDPLLARGAELAARSGNLAALSMLRGTQMLLETDPDAFDRWFTEGLDAARRGGATESEGNIQINRGYISLWNGRFTDSLEALSRGTAIFEQLAPADEYGHAGLAWLAALMGDYDEALTLATRLRSTPRPPDRVVALSALAEVHLRRGLAGTAAVVDELWDVAGRMGEAQRSVPAAAARARHLLVSEGLDVALPVFWEVIGSTLTKNMRGSHWPFSPDLAAALAAEGRVAALAQWTAEVERVTLIDLNPHNLAARALVRGNLLLVSGSPHEAVEALEEAERRYAALPAPARRAEALLGNTTIRARLGDLPGATAAIDEAEAVALRLDARPLLEQARIVRAAAISRPVLATLLFTDIVGATESAVSLGDRAWRDHLERHHGIVRRELARAGGREIDTAGDGFLAAFDSPAAGVRCAISVQRALLDAGIPIRAGLHTGECQESGGKLTGLTVHIAARVSQRAGAGEVLVSSTVKELVTGSGLDFVERGTHELKGVPGHWRLFAVA